MAEETNALLRGILGGINNLAGSLPALLRNVPQMASGLFPEPFRPMFAPMVQRGFESGLNYLTGTSDAGLRASDLLWSTGNQAYNNFYNRSMRDRQESVLRGLSNRSAQKASEYLFTQIYGNRYPEVANAGYVGAFRTALESETKSLISDNLIPAYTEGWRFSNRRLAGGRYRALTDRIASGYVTGQFGALSADDIGSLVADRAKFSPTTSSVESIVAELKQIGSAVGNIKDIVGDNVSLQQIKQLFVALTGSDLTRTSPATAERLSSQMSYLNRRYGVTPADIAGSTKLMADVLAPFNIAQPMIASYGIGLSALNARAVSRSMFVSDQQVRDRNALRVAQAVASGASRNIGIMKVITNGRFNVQDAIRAGKSLDDTEAMISLAADKYNVSDADRLFDLYAGSDIAAQASAEATDELSSYVAYGQVSRRTARWNRYIENTGLSKSRLTSIFGTSSVAALGRMTKGELEQRIRKNVKDTSEQSRLIRHLNVMVADAGGAVGFETGRAAEYRSPQEQQKYQALVRHLGGSGITSRIAQYLGNTSGAGGDELLKILSIEDAAKRNEALSDFAQQHKGTIRGVAMAVLTGNGANAKALISNAGVNEAELGRMLGNVVSSEKEKAAKAAESTTTVANGIDGSSVMKALASFLEAITPLLDALKKLVTQTPNGVTAK